MKTSNRGYAYVRVSKDVQDRQSQRDAIQKWLAAKGLAVLDTYEDAGSRDLAHKRPSFQALLQRVRDGEADFIVVAERDRFGAADIVEYHSFIQLLRTHRCKLYSAADDKELTAEGDRIEPFMATITSDRSRSEQEARGQREHRSKMAHVKRGAWPGGKPPYGYDLVCREDATGREVWRLAFEPGQYRRLCTFADGTTRRFDGKHNVPAHNRGETVYAEVTADAVAVGWVRKIFEWFADGHSYRGVATRLNESRVPALYAGHWLGVTVKGILRNPIYATGVPTWNKQAQGRFVEYVNGQWMPVERDGGRVKAARRRKESDHVSAPPRPENAVVDAATFNAVQARIRGMAAEPRRERRPRNPELFLAGLVVCADCGEPMVAWSQQRAYKCSTYSDYSAKCRCNKTRHGTLEALVVKYLEQAQQSLELFRDDPEGAWELVELGLRGEPLIAEYNRAFGRMLREARAAGHRPPPGEAWTYRSLRALYAPAAGRKADELAGTIRRKEEERGRLVRRMGLLEDEEAARAVAERVREVTEELRGLRERARPVTDRLDALREQVLAVHEQTARARRALAESLPRQRGEAVRRAISEIRVRHEERRMGKLRASRLVEVTIVPAVGAARTFREGDWPGRG